MRIEQHGNRYIVEGPLFFASTKQFIATIESAKDAEVIVDLTSSHLWDESSVGAIVRVVQKLEERNQKVTIVGMNPASTKLYER